jgi:hypothetical protein
MPVGSADDASSLYDVGMFYLHAVEFLLTLFPNNFRDKLLGVFPRLQNNRC